MTKHAPATPLPWTFRPDDAETNPYWRGASIWTATGACIARLELPNAQGGGAQNGAYMFHAANAYPKLVEALRTMIAAHGGNEQWWETEGETRYQNQIDNLNLPRPTADVIRQQITDETDALLRELGEE